MTRVLTPVRRASDSRPLEMLARFGLAARAVIYLIIGWLGIEMALGHRANEADQRGAFAEIAHHPFGLVLLSLLGVGFAGYAVWRLSEAITDDAPDRGDAHPRAKSLIRGVVYAGLAVSTFLFVAGSSRQGQAQQQKTLTGRVMHHDLGRWLVGLVGLVVIVVGIAMVADGIRRKFLRELDLRGRSASTRRTIEVLGVVGNVARGIVIALTGALVLDAAIAYDPNKSGGLDGALRTLANRPYGPYLLGFSALGLIGFGAYGLAAARWEKI